MPRIDFEPNELREAAERETRLEAEEAATRISVAAGVAVCAPCCVSTFLEKGETDPRCPSCRGRVVEFDVYDAIKPEVQPAVAKAFLALASLRDWHQRLDVFVGACEDRASFDSFANDLSYDIEEICCELAFFFDEK